MDRREFLSATGLMLATGCAVTRRDHEATAVHPDEIRELEELIPVLMREFVIPGVSITCVQAGRMVWSQPFGVKNSLTKTPVDDQTLFEAASVSKTVFAYAALKLCEKGILNLDRPLVEYTDNRFVEGDERLNKITTRQILSHSAGFAEWRSSDQPLIQSEPGTAFQYSGEGYYYLQSLITTLTGTVDRTDCADYEAGFQVCATDFDDFMKRRVLRPFRMRMSGYEAGSNWSHRIAVGHDTGGRPQLKVAPTRSAVARYGAVGGLNTTASDYAKFLIEVASPGKPDEWRLSAETLAEMARPHIKLAQGGEIDGCTAWALGWGIQERKNGNLLVHSGGQSGFRSLALASRDRMTGLIILTNSDNGGRLIYHTRFLELADEIVAL
jgi:CubicO group peptidase (beta-lactamase class C family)